MCCGIKGRQKKNSRIIRQFTYVGHGLRPSIGYDNAAKIAKTALKNKTTLKTEALKTGLINEKEYNQIVDPKKMIGPS